MTLMDLFYNFYVLINCIFCTQWSWLSAELEEDGLASGILLTKYAVLNHFCRVGISVNHSPSGSDFDRFFV
jgi:hypothetical protein